MDVPAKLLSQRIREIFSSREESWSKAFTSAGKQVARSFAVVEEAALNVGQATKRSWGSLTRPMEQHGLRLSDQVAELCRPLTTEDRNASYDAVTDFMDRSTQSARSITKLYNKYAGSMIRSAKSEISMLQDSIMSLNKSIDDLSRLIDESKLKEVKATMPDADRISQDFDRLCFLTEELSRQKAALQELQAHEPQLESELSVLSKDRQIIELKQIEARIRHKEAEVVAWVDPLSKPLRKMDRPDIRLPAELKSFALDRLMKDPAAALLELPLAELAGIFGSLREMIDHGDLTLDERRKRKALRAIDELRTDSLKRWREDYDVLRANRQEAMRQLKSSGIYDRWSALRDQISKAQTERAICLQRIADFQSQETRQRSLITAQKEAIEKKLSSILGDAVSITVQF